MTQASPPTPESDDPPPSQRGWGLLGFIGILTAMLLLNVGALFVEFGRAAESRFVMGMIVAPLALALGLGARAGMSASETRSQAARDAFVGTLLVTLAIAVPWALYFHMRPDQVDLLEQAGGCFTWALAACVGLVVVAGCGLGIGHLLRKLASGRPPPAE